MGVPIFQGHYDHLSDTELSSFISRVRWCGAGVVWRVKGCGAGMVWEVKG